MHENREISCTSWSADQDRSAKAINRTADANVQEKSDCDAQTEENSEGADALTPALASGIVRAACV